MTTIKLKNGSGAPTAGDLVQGEPALDLTNKRLYTEDSGGTVIEVGTNPTSITTGDITATGTVSFAGLGTTGDVTFGDNDKATFGAGSDLQIYHDGVSRIKELGAGGLYVDVSNDMYIRRNDTSAVMAEFNAGVAKLMFDGSQKLATTSTGIDVTGTAEADGLKVEADAPVVEISSTTLSDLATLKFTTSGSAVDSKITHHANTGIMTIDSGRNATWGGKIDFVTDTDTRMRIDNSGDVSFYNDASTSQDLYWDASTSRLGLGTTSPSTILDINTTGTGVNIQAGNAGSDIALGVGSPSTANKVVVTAGGDVGIGTTSPAYELDVNSTIHIGNDGGSSFSHSRLILDSNGASRAAGIFSHNQVNDTEWFFGNPYDTPDSFAINRQSTTTHADSTANKTNSLVTVDSSGNVGIGTQSPDTSLHIGDISATNATGSGRIKIEDTSTALSSTGGLEFVTSAFGSGYGWKVNSIDSGGGVHLAFGTRQNSTAWSEKMRLESSGNLLVGATTAYARLHVKDAADKSESDAHIAIEGLGYSAYHWLDASAYYIGQNSAYRAVRIYSGAETAGVALTNGSTSWGTFSDERLKYDVEPIDNALQSLSELRTIKYRLKDVDEPDSQKKLGVVAQDLVGVLDEVVEPLQRNGDDTEYMAVRYTELVPVLIKAVQEQQDIIENLKSRIEQLEGAN